MPIKIIKHGNLDKADPEMHGVCRSCGCEFFCRESDAKEAVSSWQVEEDPTFFIACPTCKRRVNLKAWVR